MFNTYEERTFSPKGPNIEAACGQERQNITDIRLKELQKIYQENQNTAGQIIDHFKSTITPETKLTIFEKPKKHGQPDTQINLANFEFSDNDEISFFRSDKPNTKTSMKYLPFCIITKLGIKNENGLLEENLALTTPKLDQTR